MNIKPLHNFIVIKQDENQEQRYGNIVVADLGKEKPLQGTVVEAGKGYYSATGVFIETILKSGDVVVFPAFGGTRITVDGEEYVVCKEIDIIAILEK